MSCDASFSASPFEFEPRARKFYAFSLEGKEIPQSPVGVMQKIAPYYKLLPMLLGLIFLIIGVVLAIVWATEFVVALKGALILSLLFWGLVIFLMGLSKRKARRDFDKALRDETGDEVKLAS